MKYTDPFEIEKKSFLIIRKNLKKEHKPGYLDIVTRVIHATADFEFEELLRFKNDPISVFKETVKNGANIVVDTKMIKAGISKKFLEKYNVKVKCYIDDEDVINQARISNCTRSILAMKKAVEEKNNDIFVIGNAPTALFTLCSYIENSSFLPKLVIGVPVGFVGAQESKEVLNLLDVPSIITKGRKGGSTVAVAIVNALFRLLEE
ncbi:cobalt-precorrin-8X methylmutase [Thermosipho africanus Ob7]|uniref:precorrin-8X methylmutase n=1 Tax=Thermosipho africanus TaxID=2421 RepID=UPI000571A5A8|nr:precorrin-8X methylmutase [Thermosipho africanus]RDI90514.1 cobalt-precorrin-8X methylmutase [Thermosipho africanus Ob7]